MKQFNIVLQNQPGELAKLCDVLKPVNILQITTESLNDDTTKVKLVTADENSARTALTSKYEFSEVDILRVKISDRPGELGKLARILGDVGVNIEDIYSLDRGTIALIVEAAHKEKARETLKSIVLG